MHCERANVILCTQTLANFVTTPFILSYVQVSCDSCGWNFHEECIQVNSIVHLCDFCLALPPSPSHQASPLPVSSTAMVSPPSPSSQGSRSTSPLPVSSTAMASPPSLSSQGSRSTSPLPNIFLIKPPKTTTCPTASHTTTTTHTTAPSTTATTATTSTPVLSTALSPFEIILRKGNVRKCQGCGKNNLKQERFCVRAMQTYQFYNPTLKANALKTGYRHYHASRQCIQQGNLMFDGKVVSMGCPITDNELSLTGLHI